MALTDAIAWDVSGSLIPSQGQIPNFLRVSPAMAEYELNGSIRLVPVPAYQPRFSSSGALYLEQGATNYCPHPLNLRNSGWIKGSSITVLADRVLSMWGTYEADRVSINATLGNTDAQTLYRQVPFGSAETYTVTFYLRLQGGRFGPNDYVRVSGDVLAVQTVFLGSVFNENPGNYQAVTLTVTTAGSAPANYADDNTERLMTIALYCEAAVSLDWSGVQIEEGSIRTSLINQQASIQSRGADTLLYPSSPVEGLDSFLFYLNLETWRGNGNLLQAGNFRLEIANGYLSATCGVVTATDPTPLPNSARVACRVSKGLEKVQIYVNGVLKARETLTGYVATAGSLQVAGSGVRQLKVGYAFNRDVGDGSVDIGGTAGGELLTLFSQDILFADQTEGFSQIVLPSIRLLPGRSATVKLPGIQRASQTITVLTTGVAAAAQVERVTVDTIVSGAAIQRDTVTVDGTSYEFTSDATPTAAEIAQGLTNLINSDPNRVVNASYTATNAFFDLTAITAGDPFYVSTSANLRADNQTPNTPGTRLATVSAAVDYNVDEVSIYRDFTWICDAVVTARDLGNNILTLASTGATDFVLIKVGDTVVQNSWQLAIGRNSYFAHHLEDHPDLKIADKKEQFFTLRNDGAVDRIVTPYIKITL